MNTNAFSTPSVDILEGENDFLLALDLPGVKKEDANVEIQDGRLTVEATRGEHSGGGPVEIQLSEAELPRGPKRGQKAGTAVTYRRAFTLERGLDEANMTAELDRGVLVIRVPKAPEKKPLSIPVSVS